VDDGELFILLKLLKHMSFDSFVMWWGLCLAEHVLVSTNLNTTKNWPHTLFVSGPPQLVVNGSMHPPPPFNSGPPLQQGQMMQGLPPPPQGYGGLLIQMQQQQHQGGLQQMQGCQAPLPQWGNQGLETGMQQQGMPLPLQFRPSLPGSHMPPPSHGF
jgi:hypothetical protein